MVLKMENVLLDIHEKIAWDVDGTLVGGHNSDYFCRYIIANPHKEHHLVTFRTPRNWAELALEELEEQGVPRSLIAGVHSVPDELYHAYAMRAIIETEQSDIDLYREWKAMTAKSIGCTVLVDDMGDIVADGCIKHGITFIDALKLRFT